MIVFFFTISLLIITMVFAPAMIEGVGEEVKTFDTVDTQGQDTIDDIYTAVFVRIPLVLIFGMGLWGVVWYIRRQRLIGRR